MLRRFFEEESAAEIARADGVPEETVWTRLRRALWRLRETWRQGFVERFGLSAEELVLAQGAIDRRWQEISASLGTGKDVLDLRLDDVLRAGRIQAELAAELLATPGLAEEVRSRIRETRGWFVPRLVPGENEGK